MTRLSAFVTAFAISLASGLVFSQPIPPPVVYPITVVKGGTGYSGAATDDAVMTCNGTTCPPRAVPSCSAADSALTYTTGTNTWGCNTIAAGGSPGSPTNSLQWNSAGSFAGLAGSVAAASGSLTLSMEDAATNTSTATPLVVTKTSSGTVAANFGQRLALALENGSGTTDVVAYLGAIWPGAAAGSAELSLGSLTSSALTEKLYITSAGSIRSPAANFRAEFAKGNSFWTQLAYDGLTTGGSVTGGISFASGTSIDTTGPIWLMDTTMVGAATNPDRPLHVEQSVAATNSVTMVSRDTCISTGTTAAGFGCGHEVELENGSAVNTLASTIATLWTSVTNTAESSRFVLRAMKAGTMTDVMTLDPANASGIVASIPIPTTGTDVLDLGQPKIGMQGSGTAALWLSQNAKTSTNYQLAYDASTFYINSVGTNIIRFAQNGTSVRGCFDTGGRFGIGAVCGFERQLQVDVVDSRTNTVLPSFKRSSSGGTTAQGFGDSVEVELEDAGGGLDVAFVESVYWQVATAAAESAAYGIDLINAGAIARRFTLTATGHLDTAGVALVNGDVSACGGGTPAAVGTDRRGEITVGTGGITSCTLTFDTPYAADPVCVISAVDTAAAAGVPFAATTTTTLTIGFVNSVASGTVAFICEG